MKSTTIVYLASFAVWSATAVMAGLRYFQDINWPWWVITSPVWGLFFIVVCLYTWADYKSK